MDNAFENVVCKMMAIRHGLNVLTTFNVFSHTK